MDDLHSAFDVRLGRDSLAGVYSWARKKESSESRLRMIELPSVAN